ncbi:hypothetical protein D3C71_1482250 [compost metagenome]
MLDGRDAASSLVMWVCDDVLDRVDQGVSEPLFFQDPAHLQNRQRLDPFSNDLVDLLDARGAFSVAGKALVADKDRNGFAQAAVHAIVGHSQDDVASIAGFEMVTRGGGEVEIACALTRQPHLLVRRDHHVGEAEHRFVQREIDLLTCAALHITVVERYHGSESAKDRG